MDLSRVFRFPVQIGHGVLKATYLLALPLALISCGDQGAVYPEHDSQTKIWGGTKTKDGDWMSTVALVEAGSMYCSGTAVTPYLVITAAHCIQGFSPTTISVYRGSGLNNGDFTGQFWAAKAKYNPKWFGDGENDVGYIVLNKPLDLKPTDYIPILTDPAEQKELLQVGKMSQLVGFGVRSWGFLGLFPKLGEKYEVQAPITQLTPKEVYIGGNGKDSCQGDSGGPAYGKLANGQWRVYGVVSRGGDCGKGGIWGLMHANICWIEQDSGIDLGMRSSGKCL